MPLDFTGLSYETGQLYNAEFFSPKNIALVNAFRGIGEHGVLRLGGHLSNITVWEGVGRNDPKQLRGVRHGIEDYWEWPLVDPSIQRNKKGIITRQTIENLRGFLDAVNWRLMYGLNFACGSAARAADEARAVTDVMGDRLMAFVVGNEADGFGEDPFFRAKGYDFDQYFLEYQTWVKTIREKVPQAKFAGPDTEGHINTWVKEFARRTKGDAVLLTSHFYAMGPASDPRMTAERLLQRVNPGLEEQIAGARAASAAAGGTPYRMDEGNSCFGGGKEGVSDAYASALWVADYMLHVACAGFAGVNLHGGGTGFYAPIESSDQKASGTEADVLRDTVCPAVCWIRSGSLCAERRCKRNGLLGLQGAEGTTGSGEQERTDRGVKVAVHPASQKAHSKEAAAWSSAQREGRGAVW